MTESTKGTTEMIREIDDRERGTFEARLGKILETAKDEGYPVVVVLVDEIDRPLIYPSEQNEKSITEEVTTALREATESWGPALYWGFDRIGLIQPKVEKEQMKMAVQKFLQSTRTQEFNVATESRSAILAAGIAAFPQDGETATDLIAFALQDMAESN
jgi:hypothetical protein